MIRGQVNLGSVAKAVNPFMNQSKNSLWTRAMQDALLLPGNTMLMGIFKQAVLGLCERPHEMEPACCRKTVCGT
jgi:hypothetical protein